LRFASPAAFVRVWVQGSVLGRAGVQVHDDVLTALVREVTAALHPYSNVKGQWYYLYRTVDKTDQTIDFLLTEQRDERAALRFLTKAIRRHGMPEKVTIDGREANAAAIRGYNQEHGTAIIIR